MPVTKKSKGDKYVSMDEAARTMRIYKPTLRKMAARGQIQTRKEGRTEFVLLASLRKLFKG